MSTTPNTTTHTSVSYATNATVDAVVDGLNAHGYTAEAVIVQRGTWEVWVLGAEATLDLSEAMGIATGIKWAIKWAAEQAAL